MISLRKAKDRGQSRFDWLKSFHSFSFAEYYDPAHMGFESLRVINEDTVAPGMGFGTHPHQNMEIISYVIEGELAHKDSLGNGSTIKPGEIQKMSAGSGVQHSEFNPLANQFLHFLQIWIIPKTQGIPPAYEQKTIPQNLPNQLILIGSPKGGENAVSIQQDAELYVAYLKKNKLINYNFAAEKNGWLQVIKGELILNSVSLVAGDGAAIANENRIEIMALEDAEFLFFVL